eukprot:c38518_g1_i1 orf=2-214(-)
MHAGIVVCTYVHLLQRVIQRVTVHREEVHVTRGKNALIDCHAEECPHGTCAYDIPLCLNCCYGGYHKSLHL